MKKHFVTLMIGVMFLLVVPLIMVYAHVGSGGPSNSNGNWSEPVLGQCQPTDQPQECGSTIGVQTVTKTCEYSEGSNVCSLGTYVGDKYTNPTYTCSAGYRYQNDGNWNERCHRVSPGPGPEHKSPTGASCPSDYKKVGSGADTKCVIPGHYEGSPQTSETTQACTLSTPDNRSCQDTSTPESTLIATKIVCNNEDDLPDWGAGSADITSTTADDFIKGHPNCEIVPWTFEWIQGDSEPSPKDDSVSSLAGWTSFTGSDDTIPVGKEIWVREQFNNNYIPFTGVNTDQNESAEFYCDEDVYHYDNLEYINTKEDTTHYCVAFNVLKEKPQQCDVVSDTTNIVEDGGTSAVKLSYIHSNWVKGIVDSIAEWIWGSDGVIDPTINTTEVFEKNFNLDALPSSATLEVAADNGFKFEVNGHSVIDKLTVEHNYEATQTLTVDPSYFNTGENTIKMTVTNFAMSNGTSENNPAGALYQLHLVGVGIGTCADVPQTPKISTVTMCKTDSDRNPLSGWQLMLEGEKVGSTTVAPTGESSIIEDVPAGDYIVKASGTYVYRPTNLESDAAYSKRIESDAVYQTALNDSTQSSFLPWVRENNFPDGAKGYLGIIMNDAFTDWGSVYNQNHIYALGTTTSDTSDMSFKILDDNYGDNSGNLAVDLYKGYTGVTDTNGCVTFENVPYGNYTVDEIAQDGWSNESGLGTVSVDNTEEIFTVVNKNNNTPTTPTGSIQITKYVCPTGTTVVRSANGVNGQVPAGCTLQSGATFGYVHGEATNPDGPWPELDASYAGNFDGEGVTGTNGILMFNNLPATGRYSIVETNSNGIMLSDNDILGLYCEGDGDTSDKNDNHELTFVLENGIAHCVAYNKVSVVPVNGTWSDWTPATSECGEGTFIQERTCQGASNGGTCLADEYGTATSREVQRETCTSRPVDGTWSDWTPATSECGEGTFTQERTCQGASNGGTCDGSENGTIQTRQQQRELCVPEPRDLCSNITGIQTEIPRGKILRDGRCISRQSYGGSIPNGGAGEGQVLGAETSCGIYVDKYLRKGYANDVEAVKKVQKFLNEYMSAGLTEDGFFGDKTETALKAFQLKQADKILTPWNIEAPTGIFYLTTQTEVNNIMCPDLKLPIPSSLIPFSLNSLVPRA